MSKIGYYRYKVIPSKDMAVNMYINGALASTKDIKIINCCEGVRVLKYLNQDGQFRFFGFNKYWESSDNPKIIGEVNKLVTSIFDGQSSKDNVGYRTERTISLAADDVSQEQLTILSGLWVSPRVYLYTGDRTTYDESDWVQVTVKSRDNLNRIKKGGYVDLFLDVTLPERFTINML